MNADPPEAHTAGLQPVEDAALSKDTPVTLRQEQQVAIAALVAELEARGITAKPMSRNAVLATNPAGDATTSDPRGKAMNPGLSQEVVCLVHGPDHTLWWFWAWSGPTRDSAPDLEPLCPAQDPGHAAARIAHVLNLPHVEVTTP